ncbi:hypothetical protein IscW_ISCW005708 [Ixodes scapularis]|uniref:Uncharacterized protein n=1 Tax=Ixodes scapularis TaxID=6945 RepID=B7PQJ8_IXOSC|nr:hypothetical protein IscW_ISCW005708 [Ixodes scapularis]|eukprot:XP_002436040.1 hypothetical protein IscW_ISCW005708 [Ixodes scapularis]
MRQKEASIALARIGDGEAFTNEELRMIESQFMAEALQGDPHGVRLFANRDMESFNTQGAIEGMPEMRAMKARDKICGYCNPEECNKAMEKIEQMTLTEMGNLPVRFVPCIIRNLARIGLAEMGLPKKVVVRVPLSRHRKTGMTEDGTFALGFREGRLT